MAPAGRQLPTGGDQGRPDARLQRALLEGAETAGARAELLASLLEARVFAAVTATATGHEVAAASGLVAESGAELAVLLVQAPDGSRALPVFSGLGPLADWRPDVRPVVLTGSQACAAAVDEGAQAVLLDPAGAGVVLTRSELEALAAGRVPVPGSSLTTRRGEVALQEPDHVPPGLPAALARALQPEGLRAARLLEGPDGLVVGVAASGVLDPPALAAMAGRVVRALGPDLPAEGLDLAQVAPEGPGQDLLARRGSWFTRRAR